MEQSEKNVQTVISNGIEPNTNGEWALAWPYTPIKYQPLINDEELTKCPVCKGQIIHDTNNKLKCNVCGWTGNVCNYYKHMIQQREGPLFILGKTYIFARKYDGYYDSKQINLQNSFTDKDAKQIKSNLIKEWNKSLKELSNCPRCNNPLGAYILGRKKCSNCKQKYTLINT